MLRGKELDRKPADIPGRGRSLVDQGVLEVTLLGQNVNAYGVSFADPENPRDRGAFASLLRECGRIEGLERVRFTRRTRPNSPTTSSRRWRRRPTSARLHMPLQSGSDRVLKAMRRLVIEPKFLGILDRVVGDAARRHHHRHHRRVPGRDGDRPRHSTWCAGRGLRGLHLPVLPPPGYPGSRTDGQLPKSVVQERYQRLIDLQQSISLRRTPP